MHAQIDTEHGTQNTLLFDISITIKKSTMANIVQLDPSSREDKMSTTSKNIDHATLIETVVHKVLANIFHFLQMEVQISSQEQAILKVHGEEG